MLAEKHDKRTSLRNTQILPTTLARVTRILLANHARHVSRYMRTRTHSACGKPISQNATGSIDFQENKYEIMVAI